MYLRTKRTPSLSHSLSHSLPRTHTRAHTRTRIGTRWDGPGRGVIGTAGRRNVGGRYPGTALQLHARSCACLLRPSHARSRHCPSSPPAGSRWKDMYIQIYTCVYTYTYIFINTNIKIFVCVYVCVCVLYTCSYLFSLACDTAESNSYIYNTHPLPFVPSVPHPSRSKPNVTGNEESSQSLWCGHGMHIHVTARG